MTGSLQEEPVFALSIACLSYGMKEKMKSTLMRFPGAGQVNECPFHKRFEVIRNNLKPIAAMDFTTCQILRVNAKGYIDVFCHPRHPCKRQPARYDHVWNSALLSLLQSG